MRSPGFLVGSLAGLLTVPVPHVSDARRPPDADAMVTASPVRLPGRTVTPSISGVSPRLTQPGATVTISGTDLLPKGYRVELEYLRMYRRSGEALVARIPLSGTSSQATFTVPDNMRADTLVLRYTQIASAAAPLPVSALRIPGTIAVVQPPSTFPLAQTVVVSGVTRSRLAAGTVEVRGRFLLRPVVSDGRSTFGTTATTVTYGTTTIPIAQSRYAPDATLPDGSRGVDILTLTVPDLGSNGRSDRLTVNAQGGGSSLSDVVYVEAPSAVAIYQIIAGTASRVLSGQTLYRGREYQITGSSLSLVVGATMVEAGRVAVGSSPQSVQQPSSVSLRFTLQAPVSGSVSVVASTSFGSATVGTFSVADPPASLPLADVVIVPATAVGGTELIATVSFAGSLPAGTTAGDLIVDGDPDLFEGLPRTFPINANPLTVRLETGGQTQDVTRSLTFRVTPTSGGTDTLSRSVTLRKLEPAAITFTSSSVTGGSQNTTARIDVNAPGYLGALQAGFFSPPCSLPGNWELRGSITSSDTSVAQLSPTSLCVDQTSETRTIVTRTVTSPKSVTITASLNGVSRSATLSVLPGQLTGVTANRASLVSMQSATGTLTVSAPLPGAAVLLSSSDPALSVPAKLTLGTGLTTTFPITTAPVASARTVTITAVVNGVTRSLALALQPLEIVSVSFAPSTVTAGGNSAATVRLNAVINLPITVTLSSSDPAVASVPATISFAAGQDAAIFSVQTAAPQTASATVTITATHSIVTPAGTVTTARTGTLTIQP